MTVRAATSIESSPMITPNPSPMPGSRATTSQAATRVEIRLRLPGPFLERPGDEQDGEQPHQREGRVRGHPAASSRIPRPDASNPPRNDERVGSSQNAASSAARSRPDSSGSVTPKPLHHPRVLLGQGDVGDRQVVGVERDPDAGSGEPPERVGGVGRDDARLQVGGGAQVEPCPARISSATSDESSIASGPCAIRSGSTASARRTWAAPPHSPAWSVTCSPMARA